MSRLHEERDASAGANYGSWPRWCLPGRISDGVEPASAFRMLTRCVVAIRGADILSHFSFPYRTGRRPWPSAVSGDGSSDRRG